MPAGGRGRRSWARQSSMEGRIVGEKNWRERTLKRDVGRSASEVVTARRRRGGEETTRQVEGTCVSDWFDPSRRPNTARGVFDMPIIGIATWTTGTLMI